MANDEHVALLRQGVAAWNAWRDENPNIHLDLSEAYLSEANLGGANLGGVDLYRVNLIEAKLSLANLIGGNLSGANLTGASLTMASLREANLGGANLARASLREANLGGANLREAGLSEANLTRANLREAGLSEANLTRASLREANLGGANLGGANLRGADLGGANLGGADLQAAILIDTDFSGADLTGCRIYGVSAWSLKLEGAKQQNLVITGHDEPAITVDNIEVAQFIYRMLHNQKIRDVIDTITSKVVLILGRFTQERKPVLEALREELRQRKYLPILFDFEKPRSRNTDETITLLARMARFVVAPIKAAFRAAWERGP